MESYFISVDNLCKLFELINISGHNGAASEVLSLMVKL